MSCVDCEDLTILVGSQRVFNVDLTTDGGLPVGTGVGDITLTAADDMLNTDVSGTVVPSGSVVQVTGNVVTIKVKADAVRERVLVTLGYTNSIATPGRQRWGFKFE